jgi:hypothetical protein
LLKYLLVYLVKHPNFNLMHRISCFSRFVIDGFIARGGENVHKVGRTLLLSGWLGEVCEKYDKFYIRGRACIESVMGSLFQGEF